MTQVDLIIRNGRIIDPKNGINTINDIAVSDSKIYAIGSNLQLSAIETCDATGDIVCPGLVDLHIHGYEFATELGINPDKCCLSRGVTTVVDAGSAGSGTFAGLQKYVAEKSATRVLAFLHIAAHGLAAAGCASDGIGGESDCLNQVDVGKCVRRIKDHRDILVGVKVRLAASITDDGKVEMEVYRRSLDAAKQAGVPLMVHHTTSTVPVQRTSAMAADVLCCPGDLRPGDIYTHTYHGFPSSIVDAKSRSVVPNVPAAQQKGVLFDLGHGQGAFSWTVAEVCAKESFWPDVISTDLHSGNCDGPAYDLPTVMSKMLHLGMPLESVIKAVTFTPAKAISRDNEFGTLSVGSTADITVLKLQDCDVDLEDCQAQTRRIKKRLIPRWVWRAGTGYDITQPDPFPNVDKLASLTKYWPDLVIMDDIPPKAMLSL